MSSFNGLISSLIKGSAGSGENAVLDGVSTSSIVAGTPAKFMNRALFALELSGISGEISCHIVGAIGGATYVIAGATAIAANGSLLLGSSVTSIGCARPKYVEWASALDGAGFTGSVFMAGEY